MRIKALSLSITLISCLLQAAFAAEESSKEAEDISLTIYNQNFALVREQRSIKLKTGLNYLRVENVAANIDPTTVSFLSLTAPNAVTVREQNYQYDLIDPTMVLCKSVGKKLKFKQHLPGGQFKELEGILLNPPRAVVTDTEGNSSNVEHGLVLKSDDGIILNPEGQVELKELPPGLVGKPSLLWKLEADQAGDHKSEISYQTSGINWHCDYVAILNQSDDKCDLNSWVSLDNRSGKSYNNSSLKLMAGDVHKISPAVMKSEELCADAVGGAAAAAPQFQERSFAEYHLYSLKGKTTVADNETKQMSLFSTSTVPVQKLFIYEPSGSYSGGPEGDRAQQKVAVKIEMSNSEKNHMGIPMPKGKVRVYKKDQDGALQFVGEDQIDHTPKDEKIRLYIGDAFDLVGEHKQLNFNQISDRVQRCSYEISLRNHKKEEVVVTCVEHASGDWRILNSSLPYTKKDSHTFEFSVKVPADKEVKLNYEIETVY